MDQDGITKTVRNNRVTRTTPPDDLATATQVQQAKTYRQITAYCQIQKTRNGRGSMSWTVSCDKLVPPTDISTLCADMGTARRTIPPSPLTIFRSVSGMHTADGFKNDSRQMDENENTQTYGGRKPGPNTEQRKAKHTHNSTTNPTLTEAQTIAGLENNSKHAAPRKAVTHLRAKCSIYCRGNECLCPGMFELHVLHREKPARNFAPSALLLSRQSVKLVRCARDTRAISRNAVNSRTDNHRKRRKMSSPQPKGKVPQVE